MASKRNRRTKRVTRTPQQSAVEITTQQRHHMIEEAAYFQALSRGFTKANPEEDWFFAEARVDAMLSDKKLH